MMPQAKLFLVVLLIWMCSPFSFARNIKGLGWPEKGFERDTPDRQWASHPILGTMVCPPLTRLNLLKKKSEVYLLKSIKTEQKGEGYRWTLTPKNNLTWWDGKRVTIADIKGILDQTLENEVESYGRDEWEFPDLTMRATKASLILDWDSKPKFGPYILNNIPLTKKVGDKGLTCAGLYSLSKSKKGFALHSKKAQSKYKTIFFSEPSQPSKFSETLEFSYPEAAPNSIRKRYPNHPIQCTRSIDFPIFSAILWNLQSPLAKESNFRKAMTHLSPRGGLLRSGAGYMGDLVSAPLLRAHPGYNRKVYIRPFDLATAETMLDGLGLSRKEPSGYRFDRSGALASLTIKIPSNANFQVPSVLGNSLDRVGLQHQFTNTEGPSLPDGTLTGIITPWPSADLLDILRHLLKESDDESASKNLEKIEKLSIEYRLSLTQLKPRFDQLREIHRLSFNLEPVTILMQHRACLRSSTGRKIPKVIIRNPDWFKHLIEG